MFLILKLALHGRLEVVNNAKAYISSPSAHPVLLGRSNSLARTDISGHSFLRCKTLLLPLVYLILACPFQTKSPSALPSYMMSLARFRKHTSTTTKPLQERQGNISTVLPTHSRTSKSSYSHLNDDEDIPLSGPASTRQSSFTMKTLNPRRLSLRLKNRPQAQPHSQSAPSSSSSSPSYSTTEHKQRHIEPTAAAGGVGGRPEFIYKPIRRTDYPTVMAEANAQAQSQRPVSRYQYTYISPGRSRYPTPEETRPGSRARAHYALDEESDRYRRGSDLYDDLDEQPAYSSRDAERARALAALQARPQRSAYTGAVGETTYTSAAEKRRSRAAKRLTTVMVPDADEIYDW
ncbi:hypothetical protein BJX63DRAFT_392643 [Aspergillus granulosus]|uniref:Uncharacterized protein n=1 Tax=Aspergillus granulosus TaxID=176169 RepID=A0ABR4HHP7_9EURO